MSEWISNFMPPIGIPYLPGHPLGPGGGLVAQYLANMGSGKILHDRCGMNHGTLSGFNDPPIATSGWNAGPHGGALAFDGSGDYINCGNSSMFNFGTGPFTLVARLRYIPAGTYNNIFRKGDSAGYLLRFYGNTIQFYIANTGPGNLSFSNVTDWHQFILMRDGTLGKMYVDLDLLWSDTATGNVDTGAAANNLNIGANRLGNGEYLSGHISSAMIYNRALSAEEIAYLYAFPYCFFEEAPIWQSFDPYRAQRAMNSYRQMRAA